MTTCICLSTKPFDFGYSGLLVTCLKFHSLLNSLNTCAVYWGALPLAFQIFQVLKKFSSSSWLMLLILCRTILSPNICCSNPPLLQNIDCSSWIDLRPWFEMDRWEYHLESLVLSVALFDRSDKLHIYRLAFQYVD